jgi:hypothetical protein
LLLLFLKKRRESRRRGYGVSACPPAGSLLAPRLVLGWNSDLGDLRGEEAVDCLYDGDVDSVAVARGLCFYSYVPL